MRDEQEIRDKIAKLETSFFVERDEEDQDMNLMQMLADKITTLYWVLGERE
jgi:hypothetical protein